jgi:regulator of CtrA degradation
VIVHLLDIEWLLSTLFDASLLSPSSRLQMAALFLADSSRAGFPGNYLRRSHLDRRGLSGDAIAQVKLREARMPDKSANEAEPVSFGEWIANSQAFAGVFRDGMALVEETAAYLDGPGRKESKKLERGAALAYATESMRLTTRLMQLASWLLLHRAVKEGEMSLAQANKEKTKVKLGAIEPNDETAIKLLPAPLQELIARSKALQAKIRRLDATIHPAAMAARAASASPVERQLGLLKAAFEQDTR